MTIATTEVSLLEIHATMSPKLGAAQVTTMQPHVDIRDGNISAMEHRIHYRLALLAYLQAPKFFSDIIESFLGTVRVDSGSFNVCRGVMERLGILHVSWSHQYEGFINSII